MLFCLSCTVLLCLLHDVRLLGTKACTELLRCPWSCKQQQKDSAAKIQSAKRVCAQTHDIAGPLSSNRHTEMSSTSELDYSNLPHFDLEREREREREH